MVERYRRKRKTKRFGQHFLTDPSILDRIVDLAKLEPGVPVLEIGPGCGTLSVTILDRGHPLHAVELDRDLCTFLRKQNLANFTLIEADAVKTDLAEIGPTHIIANLPYNASTRILFKLLSHPFQSLTLMFQKEVALRICSEHNKKSYGSLSIMAQLLSEPTLIMNLPPGAFSPAPKVDSAVVRFTWRRGIDEDKIEAFQIFARSAFAMRRKKLVNNLTRQYQKPDVHDALDALSLSQNIRGEAISPQDFLKLFDLLSEKKQVPES